MLHKQATQHGRSIEEEAREILRLGLQAAKPGKRDLAAEIRSYIAPLGGVNLEIPPREPMRPPPDFK
jgi:plasmid stability protein